MTPKTIYLVLAVIGTALPYSQFVPFLHEHGLDPGLFLEQLFATPVGGFFGLDVIVSSLVLWVLVAVESTRTPVRHPWAPILGNLVVGVSLGLPLFLYLRERALESAQVPERGAD